VEGAGFEPSVVNYATALAPDGTLIVADDAELDSLKVNPAHARLLDQQ
jgi:hypothetical protein